MQGEKDPAKMPLTFEILTDGDIYWKIKNGSTGRTIEYSLNGGPRVSISSTTEGAAIPVRAGDVLKFYGGNWPSWTAQNTNGFTSTCTFNAKGRVSSLRYGDNLPDEDESSNYCFYDLFLNCSGIVDASRLVLNALTLKAYCYQQMFWNCSNLIAAPALPATKLSTNCYYIMFRGCTSLAEAPELPCTDFTGTQRVYSEMFRGCTSLTKAPELPATTLDSSCYSAMFYGCTNLTEAPDLPAEISKYGCYGEMFRGCSRLSSVKCMLTNISAQYALNNWLNGVAAQGTITKKAGVNYPSGNSGIPSGWTVIEV